MVLRSAVAVTSEAGAVSKAGELSRAEEVEAGVAATLGRSYFDLGSLRLLRPSGAAPGNP